MKFHHRLIFSFLTITTILESARHANKRYSRVVSSPTRWFKKIITNVYSWFLVTLWASSRKTGQKAWKKSWIEPWRSFIFYFASSHSLLVVIPEARFFHIFVIFIFIFSSRPHARTHARTPPLLFFPIFHLFLRPTTARGSLALASIFQRLNIAIDSRLSKTLEARDFN